MSCKWGIKVAQLVEYLTLGFGLGHDLKVVRLSPVLGSVLKLCFRFSLSSFFFSLCLPPAHARPLSLSLCIPVSQMDK